MAATITNVRRAVEGNRRVVTANVTVNSAGSDTWVTGLKTILHRSVEAASNNAIGSSVSGGTVTFTGSTGDCQVRVEGF